MIICGGVFDLALFVWFFSTLMSLFFFYIFFRNNMIFSMNKLYFYPRDYWGKSKLKLLENFVVAWIMIHEVAVWMGEMLAFAYWEICPVGSITAFISLLKWAEIHKSASRQQSACSLLAFPWPRIGLDLIAGFITAFISLQAVSYHWCCRIYISLPTGRLETNRSEAYQVV